MLFSFDPGILSLSQVQWPIVLLTRGDIKEADKKSQHSILRLTYFT